jgi:ketosteroid isomerase-like protein
MSDEIKNLLQTYQRALNEANIDLVRSVYADDAIVIGQPFPTAIGIEAIISLYTDFLSKLDFNVQFDLLELEVSGDLGSFAPTLMALSCPKARSRQAVKATARYLLSRRSRVLGSSIVTSSTPRSLPSA